VPETRELVMCRIDAESDAGSREPLLIASVARARRGADRDAPLLVAIEGELDAYTAKCVEAVLLESAVGCELILDLSQVRFIDGSGINLLSAVRHRCIRNGRHLWLHDPSRCVRRLVGLLGLTDWEMCSPAGSAAGDQHPREPRSRQPDGRTRSGCSAI